MSDYCAQLLRGIIWHFLVDFIFVGLLCVGCKIKFYIFVFNQFLCYWVSLEINSCSCKIYCTLQSGDFTILHTEMYKHILISTIDKVSFKHINNIVWLNIDALKILPSSLQYVIRLENECQALGSEQQSLISCLTHILSQTGLNWFY